jgi:very-short-patch-repair endonuclease
VPDPGIEWVAAVAALIDGFDVVVVTPPTQVSAAAARSVMARARQKETVLIATGRTWPGCEVTLEVTSRRWLGLRHGAGRLRQQQVMVSATGRAARRVAPGPLPRQRMDFLLLLPHRARVVIECDGKQHYANDEGRADPRRYAAMMADDRDLRLKGYEVYRFGGADLADDQAAEDMLTAFFDRLHQRYDQ